MASRDDTPILLILPGLTGSSRSKYICQLMKDASKQDLRPVVLGYRGFDVNLRVGASCTPAPHVVPLLNRWYRHQWSRPAQPLAMSKTR